MAGRFSRFLVFYFLFLFKSHTNYAKQSQHLTENNFCIFFTCRNSILFLNKPKVNGTLTCENNYSVCNNNNIFIRTQKLQNIHGKVK